MLLNLTYSFRVKIEAIQKKMLDCLAATLLSVASALSYIILISTPVLADTLPASLPQVSEVGSGRLSYLFWDVYDARLFAPNGKWKKQPPYALSLTYLMELKGKLIADRSIEEMRKQGFHDEVTLAAWHSQMRNIFPNVSNGTTLLGFYSENKETIFYRGNQEIGRITDPEFGKYFFGIWLNETTSEPALRQALLGL